MSTKRIAVIVAVVLIAILIIGEVYIYTFSANDTYTIDSSKESDGIHYTVGSTISNDYDVALFDNGDFSCATEYYMLGDDSYVKCGNPDNPEQFVQQMKKRGIEVKTLSAADLKSTLEKNLTSDVRQCLIAIGTLPDTIYTGQDSDILFKWIDHGGRLYWAESSIGSYYSTTVSLVYVQNHSQLFLGSDCISSDAKISDKLVNNDETSVLKLRNSEMRSSIILDKLPIGSEYLAVGYTLDGCASDVLVKYGNGMVCSISGELDYDQMFDLAQIVASGLCYKSDVIGYATGSLFKNTASGVLECDYSKSKNITLYSYIGGYFLEYARCKAFVAMDS